MCSPPPFQEELKREESPYACIQSYNLVYVQKKPKRLQRFKKNLFSRLWLLIFLNYIKFSQIKIQINCLQYVILWIVKANQRKKNYLIVAFQSFSNLKEEEF